MNWIAQKFEELKARVEEHIPATHAALNALDARVSGAESYLKAAASSLETRVAALEASKVTGSCAQPDRAPL